MAAVAVKRRDAVVTRMARRSTATQSRLSQKFSVLQYNAPYTIPWRRRNELAVVVVEINPPAEAVATEVDLFAIRRTDERVLPTTTMRHQHAKKVVPVLDAVLMLTSANMPPSRSSGGQSHRRVQCPAAAWATCTRAASSTAT